MNKSAGDAFIEFLHQISKIVNECERREKDANLIVTKSIVKKLQTMENSMGLMNIAVSSGHKSTSQLIPSEIEELLKNMKQITLYWVEKRDELSIY